MCSYCEYLGEEDLLQGDDGIIYSEKAQEFHLFAEHFSSEKVWIPINYCPKCGKKLLKD